MNIIFQLSFTGASEWLIEYYTEVKKKGLYEERIMEYIRSIKIDIEIDTNKRTIEKEFESLNELKAWLDSIVDPDDNSFDLAEL